MIEQRFLTGFRELESDEPGLALEDDGSIVVVAADGSRSALGGSQAVLQAEVDVSSAEILAIFETSKVIVPAVPGKVIVAMSVLVAYVFGTTPYTDNGGGLTILTEGEGGSVVYNQPGAGFWDQAESQMAFNGFWRAAVGGSIGCIRQRAAHPGGKHRRGSDRWRRHAQGDGQLHAGRRAVTGAVAESWA